MNRCYLLKSLFSVCAVLSVVCTASADETAKHRRLNNLVMELLHVTGEAAGDTGAVFEFENPRAGWILVRTTVEHNPDEYLRVSLSPYSPSNQETPVTWHGRYTPPTLEGMRYLPKGIHRLYIFSSGEAKITELTVRAIPELIYAAFQADPLFKAYGNYDWDFLQRCGMLDACNVLQSHPTYSDRFVYDWTAGRGKRIINLVSVPGYTAHDFKAGQRGQQVSTDEAYAYWAKKDGQLPTSSGIIIDEFYSTSDLKLNGRAWAEAIKRISKERPSRVYYPYVSASEPNNLKSFVGFLKDTNCRFVYERYLYEKPTEADARKYVDDHLTRVMEGMRRIIPDFQKRSMIALGFFCGPPQSLNLNPGVNFKTFLDMQFHLLATDPTFDGLYGLEMYESPYCDEEYLRWCAKLFRHYCIEGKTDRLSGDPYALTHISNPDFADGLNGWSVSSAEPNSVEHKTMERYGKMQGRYRTPYGDSFIWMKQNADKPNLLSQDIRGLTPGRAYSVKLYAADYPRFRRLGDNAFSVDLEGADVIRPECFRGAYRSRNVPKERTGQEVWFTHRRLVFRARTTTARLIITDHPVDRSSVRPVDSELTFNGIEVEPYLIPDYSREQ